jgi:hypothetical protein
VAAGDVQTELPAVLDDRQLGRPFARSQPLHFGQTFQARALASERSYRRAEAGHLQQGIGKHLLPALAACGKNCATRVSP